MQEHHNYRSVSVVVDMELLVPYDHFLRKIDRTIDLSFISKLTQSFYFNGVGRPSIDHLWFRGQLTSSADSRH